MVDIVVLSERSNIILGAVAFLITYIVVWKRWSSRRTTKVSPELNLRRVQVVDQRYGKTRWYVIGKACISFSLLIWWISESGLTRSKWNRLLLTLLVRFEVLHIPLMLLTIDKRCRFPRPTSSWRALVPLCIFYPIFLPWKTYRLLRRRWHRPYGGNSRYAIIVTRLVHLGVLVYAFITVATLLGEVWTAIKDPCRWVGTITLYVQTLLIMLVVLPKTTTWDGTILRGVDPVYLLSLLNIFFATVQGRSETQLCYGRTCGRSCYGTWNVEGWNDLNFVDVLSVW